MIGVSLASYLPLSGKNPFKAAEIAKEDGFEFVQGLPFRGFQKTTKLELQNLPLPIKYVQRAWNPVNNLFQAILGSPTYQGGMRTTVADWWFFPNPLESEIIFKKISDFPFEGKKPTIIDILFTEWSTGHLIELCPRSGKNIPEILSWLQACGDEKPLVLDLYHLRRPVWEQRQEQGHTLGNWKDSLPKLLPRTSNIDIQPHRENNEQAMIKKGEKTELEDMLKIIKHGGYEGDFLVEAMPGKGSFLTIRPQREMVLRLKGIVEEIAL